MADRTTMGAVDSADLACSDTREMTLRHLADVRGKIASLRKLERALKTTDACQPGSQHSCPILDTLNASR
jgi:MerR family mercuric resistance operon transcriptional regulator